MRTAGDGARASETLEALPERGTARRGSLPGSEAIRADSTGPTCRGELNAIPRGLGANCGAECRPWSVAGSVLRAERGPHVGDMCRMAAAGGLAFRASGRDGPSGMALPGLKRES